MINTSVNISFTITNRPDIKNISSIQWYFQPLAVNMYSSINSTLLSGDRLTLTLPNVQLSDRGMYRINITSEAGSVQSTVNLDVFG